MKQFDVVVFGATGFTGRLICKHIAQAYHGKVTWAMAGRSEAKLQQVRSEIAKDWPSVADVPVLLADVANEASIQAMAAAAAVVISTVGPYAKYGRLVVKACVENRAHYCDLTGEEWFINSMWEEFDAATKVNGVKIVHICGYDSIPSDAMVLAAHHHMQETYGKDLGEVASVYGDSYGGFSGGTVESAMGMIKEHSKDPQLADAHRNPYHLIPNLASYSKADLPDKGGPVYPCWSKAARAWTGPFMMAGLNEKVVRQSNALLGWKLGKRMTYSERFGTGIVFSVLASLLLAALQLLVVLASKFSWVRSKLPAAGDGPSQEVMDKGFWYTQLFALSDEADALVEPKRVNVKMADPNRDPGYGSTARMILECALCMIPANVKLLEEDPYAKLCPAGILSPSAAFGLVLHDRLRNAGFQLYIENSGKKDS